MIELAADHSGGLRDLLNRSEAVQAGHQRVLKRAGDGERWQGPRQLIVVAGITKEARFQHGFGQLLDEPRNAVGPGDDLV